MITTAIEVLRSEARRPLRATTPVERDAPSTGNQVSLPIPDGLVEVLAARSAEIVLARLSDRPEYMTTKEVANYLGCSPKRIDNLCARGELPYRQRVRGGRRLFTRQEVDACCAELSGTTVREALAGA